MIPLKDNIPSRTTPWVNYTIIGLCSLVFSQQLNDPDGVLIERYGMIPSRVLHPDEPVIMKDRALVRTLRGLEQREITRPAAPAGVAPPLTLLTCIFLHGGWMHIIGNLWVLWIFGDNVEDRLGHTGFALFYLFCGIAASAAHLMFNTDSTVPTIGASGAIAGVMGAYMLLYPHAQVLSILPIFFFIQMVVLPAPVFLGIWFLIQFFQGTAAAAGVQSTGVAWWAHIGGFIAGFLIAWMLNTAHRTRPAVTVVRPRTERPTVYRVHVRPPNRP